MEESENDVETVLFEPDFNPDDCLDRTRGVLDLDLVCLVLDLGDLDTDLGDVDLEHGDLCLLVVCLISFGDLDLDLE